MKGRRCSLGQHDQGLAEQMLRSGSTAAAVARHLGCGRAVVYRLAHKLRVSLAIARHRARRLTPSERNRDIENRLLAGERQVDMSREYRLTRARIQQIASQCGVGARRCACGALIKGGRLSVACFTCNERRAFYATHPEHPCAWCGKPTRNDVCCSKAHSVLHWQRRRREEPEQRAKKREYNRLRWRRLSLSRKEVARVRAATRKSRRRVVLLHDLRALLVVSGGAYLERPNLRFGPHPRHDQVTPAPVRLE